jgi:hypothetical protein
MKLRDIAVRSFLSSIISTMFMDHYEELASESAQCKPSLWLRYVDTSVVWPHGPEWLWNFLDHLRSLWPSNPFSMDVESNSAIAFRVHLLIKKGNGIL